MPNQRLDGRTAGQIRPLEFQRHWLSHVPGSVLVSAGGTRVLCTAIIEDGVPPFLVGALVFDLRLPSPGNAVAFVVSLTLAVGVAFGWRYLLQLTAFWLLDVRGPNQLGLLLAHFLCGAYVPIVFFPIWLETLARFLPFAWMLQVPIEVWLGQHQGIELLQVYVVQALWLLALVAIGRLVLRRAVRRVVVQGG